MKNLTDDEKLLLRREVEREIYRRSFYQFVKKAAKVLEPNTNWSWNFHHKYICNLLQAETERITRKEPKTKDLIINVPFRSSKSLIGSILYPIWSWIINPDMGFINLSYSANLSTDHSNKVVSLIHSPWFQNLYGWEFVETHKSKTDFKLKTGGYRISGGVTGTVLGRGGDVIILDDANNTKKLSDVERHNTISAWKDTVSTRLNDPSIGLFINIQQRLHQNDLTGYLLELEPERWEVICLPAELSPNVLPAHLASEYKDGLLWGERFNRKVLNNFKITLGSVGYSNQLMQLTHKPEGNIIKEAWIPIITQEQFQTLLDTNKIKRPNWDFFLDSAQTEKKKNDPSGILIATKVFNNVYVRKVIERRLEFPDLIRELDNTMIAYGGEKSRMFIEPKSNGKDIIAQLKRQTRHNIVELPSPTDDKETRLNSVAPLIESGRLILIEDISNSIIVDQLTGFPQVKHDEFVDLSGYALNRYIGETKLNYLLL